MSDIKRILAETKASACLDCGKCTAACVVARHNCDFSPRMLVYDAIQDSKYEILSDGRLWECLTCAACENICTSGVKYIDFIRGLRQDAGEIGVTGQCTHSGALQALMGIMAAEDIKQDRLGWVPKQVETSTTSDTLYFVGCAPYFDTFFDNLNAKSLKGPVGSLTLLNRMGIVPALLPNERCCGHDLLNAGDVEGFLALARQNLKEISATGAKRIVVSCPEGYHTLKLLFPKYLGDTGLEVIHIMDILAESVRTSKIKFRKVNKKATYHDPCRLGRISGIYDQPREILNAIPGLKVIEMSHHRNNALCCGTQSWMNCGSINKQIQVELLKEAKATGADILITACPKCKIHLRCAMQDEILGQELQMEIKSFTGFVANALAR